jgi:NHLM bacteriocin system ABC transporter peptidase/ATP-binding protein
MVADKRSAAPVVTPSVLQIEAVECGAASLAIILGYYGRHVSLERLREECGVSRDGSKASGIVSAARRFGLIAEGYKKEPEQLREIHTPAILHWGLSHFLVLEGFGTNGSVHLNDPAHGRRRVTATELSETFSGVVLSFKPGPDFERGGERPSAFREIKKRLHGVRGFLGYIILTSLILVVPGLVLPALSRVFVDDVLVQGREDWLRPLLLGMVLTALARAGLTAIKQYHLRAAYSRVAAETSARFFWRLLELPVGFFLARHPGEVADRIQLNDRVAELFSGRLAMAAFDLMMSVFYLVLLAIYDVKLTLVAVVIALLNLGTLALVARRRTDQNHRLKIVSGKLVGASMGALQMIETIKANGGEADFFARWAAHFARVQNAVQELEVSTLYLGSTPLLLSALNSAAILTVGGLAVIHGTMTVGMLVAYQTLVMSFLGPVESLIGFGGALQGAHGDLKRLADALEYRGGAPRAELERGGHTKFIGGVTIEDLTFGYVPHANPLVDRFSLEVPPAARVALVGGSGSGKSTVARLVAGLYEPWTGSISFDGVDRREIHPATLSHSVAMVDQEITLFEGTIRENLTLWDASIPERRIVQAARDAMIHDEIMERREGYDAHVEEAGRNFSGGQRQRLEIARALVRDPSVLLLDEATSALDPATEQAIDENLRRRGCTCLIVAHRLSTIRDCDVIVVVDEGVVAEKGTHEELMRAGGRYAKLMGAA